MQDQPGHLLEILHYSGLHVFVQPESTCLTALGDVTTPCSVWSVICLQVYIMWTGVVQHVRARVISPVNGVKLVLH